MKSKTAATGLTGNEAIEFLERIHKPVCFTDSEGNFLWVNSAFCKMLGYSFVEIMQMNAVNIYNDKDDRQFLLECVHTDKMVVDYEEELKTKQGEVLVCHVESHAVLADDGSVIRYEKIILDVSEKKRYIEKLETKNSLLEEFACMVAHDLKKPLVTIHDFTEVMKIKNNLEYLSEISTLIEEIIIFIDLLLGYARAGKVVGDRVEYDIGLIIKKDFANSFKNGKKLEINPNLPKVLIDVSRMRQALDNIINNSIRANNDIDNLVISVDYFQRKQSVVFSISDNGIGIDPDHLQEILEPHFSRREGGSGLGLPIAKKIIEAHGGKLWAESEGKNKGATFLIELPKN